MTTVSTVTPGVDVISTAAQVPGLGCLAVNAFVLHGDEPILVDTGTVSGSDDFMAALESVIDPSELSYLWLTHTDFDHIGSMARLLDENPRLRVITSFLGVGIMVCRPPHSTWAASTCSTPDRRSRSPIGPSRP